MAVASRSPQSHTPPRLALGTAGVLLALLSASGCADEGKPVGTEGASCYPNDTCNAGLVCLSKLCVRLSDGSVGDAGVDAPAADGRPAADAQADVTPSDAPASEAVDETPPEVSFTIPHDGDAAVEPSSPIIVAFSEAMDAASLTEETFEVRGNGLPVAGTIVTKGATCTFTPAAPLDYLTLYTARITTGAKDLAGLPLGADHEWQFVTRDRSWQTAELLEYGTANAERPHVALDASGNAMAVWAQFAGSRYSVWANRLARSSGSWSGAELIETNDQGDASDARVALDASGNAMAVFWQHDGARYNVWANRYSAAAGVWGTAQLIESGDQGDASAPQVALDASGNATAVFWLHDGARYDVWANRYVSSTSAWGAAQLIETSDQGDAAAPAVAMNAAGAAVAVFWQQDGARYNIWANRYAPVAAAWGTAEPIETTDTGDATDPQVAMDLAGNAVAVWVQSDGARYSAWANRYSAASGTWGVAELLETDDAGDASTARVAMDEVGNAVAVWVQSDGTRFNVMANRYLASSGSWGTAVLLEHNDQGSAGAPHVAADRDGNAIAVWPQSDGTHADVWANRFVATKGSWGTARRIEASAGGDAVSTQVAMDPAGNAVAVWAEFDGVRFDVWCNRFE